MQNTTNTEHILLLEIGTEEVPARFLPEAIVKLKGNSEKIFSEYRVPFQSIKTYATPRRLSLIAVVSPLQESAEKEIWGPPVNAAFDKDGKPTKAAEAFAKTHGLKIEELLKKEKGKGTYLVALIKEASRQTEHVLPEMLPKLILSLNFPKSMRWGDGSLRFARPIHWILATYGNKKVAFEVDGLKSDNMTRGHRFLSPAAFEVKDCRAYINLLKNNFIILDPDEREKIILDGAKKLASSVNALLIEDEELFQHVTNLVEYPVPVLGTFPAEYLYLPKELLITVMKGHQKYFALQDAEGGLVNYFIIVSNTKRDNAETIKKGAEKVIKARFEDARFYYEDDKRIPLRERLEGLKKVVYHEKLGTLYDKSLRIASIADFIADRCYSGQEQFEQFKRDVNTAALLSKTDLVSGVVGEFPELQGIMGGYYALHEDYNKDIAKALTEHYLPAHSGDRLPETDIGAILSLSDKVDNIASFFIMGLVPTGTEDPFALRRQALGIIAILTDKKYNLNVSELLEKALNAFAVDNNEAVMNDLVKFFEQRVEPLFQSKGYPLDSISAIIHFVKDRPFYSLKEMLDAIQRLKEEADYDSFLLAIKRVNNIAPKGEAVELKEELLSAGEEKILYASAKAAKTEIESLVSGAEYYEAIRALKTLKEPINNFFDKVLVMDKNEKIKNNRLSLIKTIRDIALQIADFSKLS
ncbi:MAG: glycine--tRNA ligase subunit beta [Nitrospirae bacterium]|nr:glycine--tRNA ligase subunit beta [Nitrospirota bacterium]